MMNEEVIQQVAQASGFTRWEIVLMATVAGLFCILIKLFKDSITAANNSTNAVNNNTQAFKEFKQELKEMWKERT